MARSAAVAIVALSMIAVAYAAATPVISQKGRVFAPGEISIRAGETVQIANDDDVLHHVYVESQAFNFDSGEQPPGKQVAIRFFERGTFDVQCEIHPKMRLRVHVR